MRQAGSNPEKTTRFDDMAQEHGWPRGFPPLAMTQMKLNE
jgi:hypothetical protein